MQSHSSLTALQAYEVRVEMEVSSTQTGNNTGRTLAVCQQIKLPRAGC